MPKINKWIVFVFLFPGLAVAVFSQTPAPTPFREERVTVVTEEIKVNVAAFDERGEFVAGVRKEDLVVGEDGRLQQASSVRRVAANVLIALDTGGEMRSNLSETRAASRNLVASLQAGDRLSIFQFGDRAEMLADWTTDKTQALEVLDRKLSFGKRSALDDALRKAVEFFYKTPLENRHLVIIAGGTDGFNDAARRAAATKSLAASDITVHVVSFTSIQTKSASRDKSVFKEGEYKPRRLPEEVVETLPDPKGAGRKKQPTPRDTAKMPRLGSITLDAARIKRASKDQKELKAGELFLTEIAENAGGEIFLPRTFDELIAETVRIAKIIGAQYVITYVPKRPLNNSPPGEIRRIEITSKRAGLQVEARRKSVVAKRK